MWKGQRREPKGAPAREPQFAETEHASGYRPAVDGRAQRLIARIQRDHTDTEAVLALKQHYLAHADLPSLANLMEGWAATLRDERSAADAYVEAAQAVLQGLADRARGTALLQRALERDPSHTAALQQLLGLFEQAGDDAAIEHCLQAVAGELGRRLALPEQRADVHFRLGRHYEQRLGMAGRAIAEYRTALELDPHMRPAIRAARAIYLATQRGEPAAAMYELEIASLDDAAEQYRLLCELAQHRRTLGDLDGAVLALRRALKALPQQPAALEALAALLAERAGQGTDAASQADRGRAAELYFQLARCVPRSEARAPLLACRTLAPDHARAARMLAELDAYGAHQSGAPALGFLSQAELEALDTGVYQTPPPETGAESETVIVLDELSEADEEITAWLEDDAVELIDEDVAVRHMVPVSDRPPPSTTPSDKPHDTLRNELL